ICKVVAKGPTWACIKREADQGEVSGLEPRALRIYTCSKFDESRAIRNGVANGGEYTRPPGAVYGRCLHLNRSVRHHVSRILHRETPCSDAGCRARAQSSATPEITVDEMCKGHGVRFRKQVFRVEASTTGKQFSRGSCHPGFHSPCRSVLRH